MKLTKGIHNQIKLPSVHNNLQVCVVQQIINYNGNGHTCFKFESKQL